MTAAGSVVTRDVPPIPLSLEFSGGEEELRGGDK